MPGVRFYKPDPEHAKQVVAGMSDRQVRDMLAYMGSTTSYARPIEECRKFLAKYLGTLPREEEDLPKA